MPAPRPCWRWLPIQSVVLAPRSDSSASCIPGDKPCAASPYSLCRTWRWTLARSHPLDLNANQFLLACESAQSCFSRQVCRRFGTRLSTSTFGIPWRVSATCGQEGVRNIPGEPLETGLGGLREASVWRSRTRPAVSGSLYTSRGHLQSPASFGQRIRGPLPLEGLQESQQETDDDS